MKFEVLTSELGCILPAVIGYKEIDEFPKTNWRSREMETVKPSEFPDRAIGIFELVEGLRADIAKAMMCDIKEFGKRGNNPQTISELRRINQSHRN